MISSRSVADRIRSAFTPTQLGVVGLTDQLLEACVGGDVVFERVGDDCIYHWTVDGDTEDGAVPIRPAAFRTVLARVATLCNEQRPNSVTPYRGDGVLSPRDHPAARLRVQFVNTPEQQQLTLCSDNNHQSVEVVPVDVATMSVPVG